MSRGARRAAHVRTRLWPSDVMSCRVLTGCAVFENAVVKGSRNSSSEGRVAAGKAVLHQGSCSLSAPASALGLPALEHMHIPELPAAALTPTHPCAARNVLAVKVAGDGTITLGTEATKAVVAAHKCAIWAPSPSSLRARC